MCGTGDISVCDFKAHAVVVGGSWHFREKVSDRVSISCLLLLVSPATAEDKLNWKQLCFLGWKFGFQKDEHEDLSQEQYCKYYEIMFNQVQAGKN